MYGFILPHGYIVALRKESVDRNIDSLTELFLILVALRKESVDRNEGIVVTKEYSPWSLSARRAWIEMSSQCSSDVR